MIIITIIVIIIIVLITRNYVISSCKYQQATMAGHITNQANGHNYDDDHLNHRHHCHHCHRFNHQKWWHQQLQIPASNNGREHNQSGKWPQTVDSYFGHNSLIVVRNLGNNSDVIWWSGDLRWWIDQLVKVSVIQWKLLSSPIKLNFANVMISIAIPNVRPRKSGSSWFKRSQSMLQMPQNNITTKFHFVFSFVFIFVAINAANVAKQYFNYFFLCIGICICYDQCCKCHVFVAINSSNATKQHVNTFQFYVMSFVLYLWQSILQTSSQHSLILIYCFSYFDLCLWQSMLQMLQNYISTLFTFGLVFFYICTCHLWQSMHCNAGTPQNTSSILNLSQLCLYCR